MNFILAPGHTPNFSRSVFRTPVPFGDPAVRRGSNGSR